MSHAGPPVLLLHGQPGSARDWARVTRELAPGAEAIAVDRPGWDGTSAPRDLPGNVAAALAVLDARGIERAIVVGHSLGAAVAAWLAADHPGRVAALVLAAPAANLAALEWTDRWLTLPVAGALTSAASLGGLGLALSAAPVRGWLTRRSRLEDGYLRAAAHDLRRAQAWRAFDLEQRALVNQLPQLEGRLASVHAPTWIVTGEADRVVPGIAARRLIGQIPRARLVVVPGAGHLLPQLHPRALARTIREALGTA